MKRPVVKREEANPMAGFFKSHLQSYFHGDSLPIIAALSVKNRCVCWIPWPTGLG